MYTIYEYVCQDTYENNIAFTSSLLIITNADEIYTYNFFFIVISHPSSGRSFDVRRFNIANNGNERRHVSFARRRRTVGRQVSGTFTLTALAVKPFITQTFAC